MVGKPGPDQHILSVNFSFLTRGPNFPRLTTCRDLPLFAEGGDCFPVSSLFEYFLPELSDLLKDNSLAAFWPFDPFSKRKLDLYFLNGLTMKKPRNLPITEKPKISVGRMLHRLRQGPRPVRVSQDKDLVDARLQMVGPNERHLHLASVRLLVQCGSLENSPSVQCQRVLGTWSQ